MTLVGFFLKVADDLSRVWLGSWFLTGLFLLIALRLIMARLIRRWSRNGSMYERPG